ncbi:DUF4402 domain-containing protein [Sphingomonas arenae]|uniref:DUF4402 domain-containing protein n=1 Tax=Sphingomonas arenae TaxID=2812555 RepID=UPI001967E3CF|nr:DUF4402 domain-containing protein [Sphingomonas arenae]
MTLLRLVLTAAALLLVATPAAAQTRTSANVPAKLSVLRPLTLLGEQELNFGTVILGPGTWSNAAISVSAAGVRTCAAAVACTGTTSAARFRLSGTNNQTVVISAPAVTLVNAANSTQRLTMTPIAPATVLLTNSGNPGTLFSVGGTISVSSTTPDGVYSGTLEVTVEYQ